MKKTITTLVLASLVATSLAFVHAQDGSQPPPGERRGEWGQKVKEFRQEFNGEKKEMREEYREDRKEAVGEFREGMKERRAWNAGNASGTATGTRPTPFKDLREDMKEARKEFKDDMRGMRDDMKEKIKDLRGMMKPKMATLTDVQSSTIAGKLGITVEELRAQLASGTKLKELIKDKINPEEMKQILPPRVASMTRPRVEQGFFNNFRSQIFGKRQETVQQVQNEFGEIEEITRPLPPQNFFRRLFNW